ncbi:hypothetical protein [Methanobrevibacter sp. V74]|nr:hypothetical protein [Methanobrevibacter sp. V74]
MDKYKTEAQILKEENKNYKDNLNELWDEINNMKEREKIWNEYTARD